jgi:hypothetical protein
MRKPLFALTVGQLLLTLACSSPNSSAPQPASNNALLATLAQEDQSYRRGVKVERTDEERAALVLGELGAGKVMTPADRANAALVLQHTGLKFCDGKLVSHSPDNYLLAYRLASSAYDAGHQPARALVAQTIDRYLSFTKGMQKYGTNRVINQETGKEEWVPIDRSTTDAERAKYGVPPLETLLRQFPEQGKAAPARSP